MERISYPKDLIEQIGAYLATRPFQDVYKLISDLQSKGEPVKQTEESE